MKTKKRIWAILLSVAMIITMLPAMAFAEEEVSAEEGQVLTEEGAAAVEEEPVLTEAAAATAEPVSVTWDGAYPLRGTIGTYTIYNLDTPDQAAVVVVFSDNSIRRYVCTSSPVDGDDECRFLDESLDAQDDWDEEGACAFVLVDEEENEAFAEGANDGVRMLVNVPYEEGEEVSYKTLTTTVDVICSYDRYPLSAEFIPAEGFTPKAYIGYNYLDTSSFYGEGNAFKVMYKGYDADGNVSEFPNYFYYAKGTNVAGEAVEGFFRTSDGSTGDVNKPSFELAEGKEAELKNGSNEVEFEYEEFVDELGKPVRVKFTIDVNVKEHNAYANYPVYGFTGKVIQPTFKVFDSEDRLIPASEYTVGKATAAAMGWYQVTITFKDKSKYEDSITGYYAIGPKKPKLTSITAGKKKLTVKWKKLSKLQLKLVDGMVIELATDKNFNNIQKTVKVSKKQIKSGKKVVKGLKKGKKYYVRVHVFKNVTQNGEKITVPAPDSNVKSKKTK